VRAAPSSPSIPCAPASSRASVRAEASPGAGARGSRAAAQVDARWDINERFQGLDEDKIAFDTKVRSVSGLPCPRVLLSPCWLVAVVCERTLLLVGEAS
jgi:hypothetical protein